MKLIVLVGTLLLSISSFAGGQCQKLTTAQANKAMKILSKELKKAPIMVVDQYCEACLDEIPAPIVVESIEHFVVEPGNKSEIEINGKVTDLAYIFVNGENLAQKINCKTVAVSKNLD